MKTTKIIFNILVTITVLLFTNLNILAADEPTSGVGYFCVNLKGDLSVDPNVGSVQDIFGTLDDNNNPTNLVAFFNGTEITTKSELLNYCYKINKIKTNDIVQIKFITNAGKDTTLVAAVPIWNGKIDDSIDDTTVTVPVINANYKISIVYSVIGQIINNVATRMIVVKQISIIGK